MKKIITTILMMVVLSFSVFAASTLSVPSSASAGQSFQITINADGDGGFKILKPSNCQYLGTMGTLGTDGYVRRSMSGGSSISDTYSCSSTATFSGEYTTGAGWQSFSSKTITIGSTPPPSCSCSGKSCGDDGCGTSCGSCSDGQSCNNGVCQSGETPTGCNPACSEGYTCSNSKCVADGSTCPNIWEDSSKDCKPFSWLLYAGIGLGLLMIFSMFRK